MSELFFIIVFTVECCIKIIGMGFALEKYAYLRDRWNVLDFIVVISGLIGQIPGIPNLTALRTLRVLRPLRSVSAVPGMKILVTSLLNSLPALVNVVVFLFFVFLLFGISGFTYQRCRFTKEPEYGRKWIADPKNSSSLY